MTDMATCRDGGGPMPCAAGGCDVGGDEMPLEGLNVGVLIKSVFAVIAALKKSVFLQQPLLNWICMCVCVCVAYMCVGEPLWKMCMSVSHSLYV